MNRTDRAISFDQHPLKMPPAPFVVSRNFGARFEFTTKGLRATYLLDLQPNDAELAPAVVGTTQSGGANLGSSVAARAAVAHPKRRDSSRD
jgi:hypothetical protein